MLKFISLSIFCFYINGCGDSEQKIKKDFNTLKIEVKKNYEDNKQVFNEIKNCFKFKYIKYIEFKKGDNVKIQYKVKDTAQWGVVNNDTHEWGKIEADINDKEIKSLLDYEGVSKEFLLSIIEKLKVINTNNISITDGYDVTKGFDFKIFEIKYLKEVNDLHFYYRVFDRPIDSITNAHHSPQTQENIGGILDKDIIYYYNN